MIDESTQPVIARLFMNGKSQAVRLPKAFRFQGTSVRICREGDKVILQPIPPSWDRFFQEEGCVSEDFIETRQQGKMQQRDAL